MLARDNLKGLVVGDYFWEGEYTNRFDNLYSGVFVGDFFDCRNSEVWRWETLILESLNFKIWLRVEVTSIFVVINGPQINEWKMAI